MRVLAKVAKVAKVATTPLLSKTIPQSEHDKVKGKCARCLKPGHMWYLYKARATPASDRTSDGRAHGQNNSRETVCCLANAMTSGTDGSCAVERKESLAESFAEKWVADSGASFIMTHSADPLSDVDCATTRLGSMTNTRSMLWVMARSL